MSTHNVNFTDSSHGPECDYRATYFVTLATCDEPESGTRKGDPDMEISEVVLLSVCDEIDERLPRIYEHITLSLDPDDPVVITECEKHFAEQERAIG